MTGLKIAIAQINCTVGDVAGNAARILRAAEEAAAQGADLLLTPELALAGYPPEDLLLRPDFYRACDRELSALAGRLPLPAIVGHPASHAGSALQRRLVVARRPYREHLSQAPPADLRGLRRGTLFHGRDRRPGSSPSRACVVA